MLPWSSQLSLLDIQWIKIVASVLIALIEKKKIGLMENIEQVPILGFRKHFLENSGVKCSHEMMS